MSLKQRITDDMKAALLGGNRFEGETIRNLKAAILNEEVAKNKREEGLDDSEIEQLVAREVKKRNESITLYEQNARPELAEDEKKEIEVLKVYLPTQLSEEEITSIVREVVSSMDGASMQQMGQVIGTVKAKVGTSADGATVAKIVKQELNS